MAELAWSRLDHLPPGKSAVIRRLEGGREFANHLAGLGLAEGSVLRVLENRRWGPLLVLVRETRVALGRGEAMKVWVEGCDGSE